MNVSIARVGRRRQQVLQRATCVPKVNLEKKTVIIYVINVPQVSRPMLLDQWFVLLVQLVNGQGKAHLRAINVPKANIATLSIQVAVYHVALDPMPIKPEQLPAHFAPKDHLRWQALQHVHSAILVVTNQSEKPNANHVKKDFMQQTRERMVLVQFVQMVPSHRPVLLSVFNVHPEDTVRLIQVVMYGQLSIMVWRKKTIMWVASVVLKVNLQSKQDKRNVKIVWLARVQPKRHPNVYHVILDDFKRVQWMVLIHLLVQHVLLANILSNLKDGHWS
jgi:hypothetical protein